MKKKVKQPKRNTYVIPADAMYLFKDTPVKPEDGERFKCECPCGHEFYRFKDICHAHTFNKNGRTLHTIAYNTGETSKDGKKIFIFMMWEVIKLDSGEYMAFDNIDMGTGMSWGINPDVKPVAIDVSTLAKDINQRER